MNQMLFSENYIPVEIHLKMFDAMIKPMLLYCSEIWSDCIINKGRFLANLNSPMEKLHIKFCKSLLKVNSKATNLACLLELGRLPLAISSIRQMLKYWMRLNDMDHNTLVHEAYQLGIQLDDAGVQNWVTGIKTILNFLDLGDVWTQCKHNSNYSLLHPILDRLIKRFKTVAENSIYDDNKSKNHKNKLRTYRLLKKDYTYEKYLTVVKNPNHRSALTKLRISAHTLPIEMGRYKNIDISHRKCKVCDLDEVEDEKHFLLKCKLHQEERIKLFTEHNLSSAGVAEEEIMIKILTSTDNKEITDYAKYIFNCFNRRDITLKKPPAAPK
ncbi:uncharacterized protein LOC144359815 [Saccoglossus kowalevskii]